MIPVHLSPLYACSRNKHTLLHRTFTVRVMWNLSSRARWLRMLLFASNEKRWTSKGARRGLGQKKTFIWSTRIWTSKHIEKLTWTAWVEATWNELIYRFHYSRSRKIREEDLLPVTYHFTLHVTFCLTIIKIVLTLSWHISK